MEPFYEKKGFKFILGPKKDLKKVFETPWRRKYDANELRLYTHTKMSKMKTQWEKAPILQFTLNFRGFWPNFQGVWAQCYWVLFVLKMFRLVRNFRKTKQTVTEKAQRTKSNA